ncbi:sulfite oxidase [Nocardia sp. NPDC101769]|uniref:sulfite oxidase n=1 Tax=Nocardia sp. NPDC101769 TaxID=3364333 RepID=UPI003808FD61
MTSTAGRATPWISPRLAQGQATAADLLVIRSDPLNAETPISELRGTVTSNARFYKRNHFRIPDLDPADWRLRVTGQVRNPSTLTLPDLRRMPSRTRIVTLECAGNDRSTLNPPTPGEQWGPGAVGTAEWTGVPLIEVLARAVPAPGAREVVFRGADSGPVDRHSGMIRFERSLDLTDALHSGALLVYAMNGEPLPALHGRPLRLVVPDWYGVASVKWLTDIEVLDHRFAGFFQTEKYCYEWERGGQVVTEPVRLQRVRSVITVPASNAVVRPGSLTIQGVAWSGLAPITSVEVSIGEGSWQKARLPGKQLPGSWREWDLVASVDAPGPTTVRVRATDAAGHTQPDEPAWNRLGYGANAVHCVPIRVTR